MTDDGALRTLLGRAAGPGATLAETHVSILAFTSNRVFKAKKAVRFPFVDLSTAAKRRANCERELALNRRLAPDVYLRLVDLRDDAGRIVECALEMRRLPDSARLATRLHAGEHGDECVDAVAMLLAHFHASAEQVAGAGASELWQRGIDEVRPFGGRVLTAATVTRVEELVPRYLAGRRALFETRAAAGRLRDGHGDLLADDIFCFDDGPRILDCLEFDDRLRAGDVCNDLAFLAMDLEWHGRPDLAARLLATYRAASGDDWPPSLAHFFIAYRAHVRAKVACLRAEQGDEIAASNAEGLLELCRRHLETARIRLVLVGGLPGTGKSTVAAALAAAEDAVMVRSDEVRKQLAGLAPTTSAAAPYGEGLYAPEQTDAVYTALIEQARPLLERGVSVVLDASWSKRAARTGAARLADAISTDLIALRCVASAATTHARITARAARGNDPSDATVTIAARMEADFDPWDDATTIDTTGTVDASVAAARAAFNR